ncbi:MAG: PhoH family protein [Bacteroidetes bacterium]|nr:PhoH family protein [Rhodothermia bacterium]MCS7155260.1 PhoH family protein [Bacteroidota bacterium]MCX7907845.1 PhoH family protein [Bacteroidota bacterium]MDW8138664.1 PhoH family protein [Bacteroidota bacterium]MDW8284750.1 PhoH family protein [Bacteroidota bacterium]
MIERRFTVTSSQPLLLFGFNDQFLRKIERTFPALQLIARGKEVILRGQAAEVEQAERILLEMQYVLNRTGQLYEQDVDTVIELVTGGRSPSHGEAEEVILYTYNGGAVVAKTPGQRALVEAARENDIVFAIGPAGTGKTYTAVALALAALQAREVKKIVLTRPAVEAGESLGFLPGDLREKIDPYLRPLYDALEDMLPPDKLRLYLDRNTIEIVPLAYMRGRTLHNAFVILDEAQNATTVQMKMFLTRLGANSRAIITGDVTQTDLPRRSLSGLVQVQEVLAGIEGIAFVYLGREDVVRHRLVQDIIEAYERYRAAYKASGEDTP